MLLYLWWTTQEAESSVDVRIGLLSAAESGTAGRKTQTSVTKGQRPTHWPLLFAYQLIRNINTAEGNVTGVL